VQGQLAQLAVGFRYPVENGLNIELLGRLSMLLGPTDIFPNMRIAASVKEW
jgi:hypothetical protein